MFFLSSPEWSPLICLASRTWWCAPWCPRWPCAPRPPRPFAARTAPARRRTTGRGAAAWRNARPWWKVPGGRAALKLAKAWIFWDRFQVSRLETYGNFGDSLGVFGQVQRFGNEIQHDLSGKIGVSPAKKNAGLTKEPTKKSSQYMGLTRTHQKTKKKIWQHKCSIFSTVEPMGFL